MRPQLITVKTLINRSLRLRCPQCGEGKLFERYFFLRERCPHCHRPTESEQGAFTGAMYVSAVFTELFALFLAVFLFYATSWDVTTMLCVGVPLSIAFSLWFFPYAKSAWCAVDFYTDQKNLEGNQAQRD